MSDKTLIWDFDGTLARREGLWSREALDDLHPCHEIADEQIVPLLRGGFPWHEPLTVREANRHPDDWWRMLDPVFLGACRTFSLTDEQGRRFCDKVRAAYLNPARWVLFEDVLPCLARLSDAGWKHVMLSNHVPELRQIVRSLGLSDHFAAVFNSAETGIEKPHPQAFRNVLEFLGESSEVWMIGDSMAADVQGAKAVGLRSVLVRTVHPDADCRCESLCELPAVLGEG